MGLGRLLTKGYCRVSKHVFKEVECASAAGKECRREDIA